MPGWTNSDNKFSISPFIVGTTLGDGCHYTSIQAAINDCITAGGGYIQVRDGVYTENLVDTGQTFAMSITITGAMGDGRLPNPGGSVRIIGSHTFTFEGSIVFENVTLEAPAGDTFAINSPLGGLKIAAFKFCQVTSVASRCFLLGGSGVEVVSGTDCQFTSASECFDMYGSAQSFIYRSNIVSNLSVGVRVNSSAVSFQGSYSEITGLSVALQSLNDGSVSTSYCKLNSTTSYAIELVTAISTANSFHDVISSGSATTHYVGGIGNFNYTDNILTGSATNIDPALTVSAFVWRPHAEMGIDPGVQRGTAAFDSNQFFVNDGFVTHAFGLPISGILLNAFTPPGTNPAVPDATGILTIFGAAVAPLGIPVQTNSIAANSFELQVQRASSSLGSDAISQGLASFDNTQFSVDGNGYVSLAVSPAGTFPVDNGGPGVPLAGAMSILGTTSVDFPISSGIETHVGATTNEIYIEDRRWLSSFVVDPSAVIGLRGTYQTIQAAINAVTSVATIYVRPGTYVESLTIPGGLAIQIIGSQSSQENSIVSIIGDITHAGVGTSLALENLSIGFTGAVTFTQSEGSTTAKNCNFFSTASSACVITTAAASFFALDCQFQTAGISDLIQVSDSLTTTFDQCSFNSPTANVSALASADVKFNYCKFNHVIVASDSSTVTVQYSRTDNPVNPAYVTTVAATLNAFHNVVNTTDASTFFASGVGTFNYCDLVLLGDTAIDPALTANKRNWQPYCSAGTSVTAFRGTAGFDSTQFSVVDGFVSATGSIPISFQTNAGVATPAAGVLTILGSSEVRIVGTGSTVTIHAPQWGGFPASAAATANTGGFVTAAGAIVATLPTAPGIGRTFTAIRTSTGNFTMTATGGAVIHLGAQVSVANGSVTSTALGDSLRLVADASGNWWAEFAIGNFTVI